jgi:hypothetical protein
MAAESALSVCAPQIRDLNPFTLHNVSPRARPFVNLACRGDSVTILGAPGTHVELDDAYAPLDLPDCPQVAL